MIETEWEKFIFHRYKKYNMPLLEAREMALSGVGVALGFARRGAGFPDRGSKYHNKGYLSMHLNTIFHRKFHDRQEIFPRRGANIPRRGGYSPPAPSGATTATVPEIMNSGLYSFFRVTKRTFS